jgi:flagellin-specific chaperone FliS
MRHFGTFLINHHSTLFGAILCIPLATYVTAATTAQSTSAGTKEDVSVLAGKMLDDTNQARIAVKDKNKASALQHVEQAETELRELKSRALGATMVPVYQEFVSVTMLQPVIAEQHTRQANAHEPAVVHQVAGDYTDVAVSTTVAQRNLEAAKTALEKGNWSVADRALGDVQDGVTIESVEANMPLAKARENFILARAAAEKGNYTEAQAALKAASNALGVYIKAGRSHAAAAKSLKQQIDTYDNNLQQNHSGVVAKINDWWNTTSDWTPYKPSGQMSASR